MTGARGRLVCRQGETPAGKTTVVLQRDEATVVINDVPGCSVRKLR
jgi:hypothetical protein